MSHNPHSPHRSPNPASPTHDPLGSGDGSQERLQTILDGRLAPSFDLASLTSILALLGTTSPNGSSATESLSTEDLQRLLNLFSSRQISSRGVTEYTLMEDAEDDDEYIDEDDEDTGYSYSWGSSTHAPSWDRSHDWWPEVTEPQKEGLDLLYSGEFGRALHQIQSRKGQNNVARNLLNRGMSSRPTPKEDITCVRVLHQPTYFLVLLSNRMSFQIPVALLLLPTLPTLMSDNSLPVCPYTNSRHWLWSDMGSRFGVLLHLCAECVYSSILTSPCFDGAP